MASDDKERQERLAAALRENLKRRKAQARAQDGSGGVPMDCQNKADDKDS